MTKITWEKKQLIGGLLTVSEGQSMTGSTMAGRQAGTGAVADSSLPDPQATGRELEQEWV